MNIKALGYTDGAEAYRAEKPRSVAGTAQLEHLEETHTQAERVAYMQGWYNGWDMANVRDDSSWKRGLKS